MDVAIGFLGILAAATFVWAFGRHNALKVRQMQHEERITALQKGMEIPHQVLPSDHGPGPANGARRVWFRLTILGLAMIFFFGGVGLLLALLLVQDPEFSGIWALGLIPIMVSIGLFLFWAAAGRELRSLESLSE